MADRSVIERRRTMRLLAPLATTFAAVVVAGALITIGLSIPTLASSSARSCDVSLQVRDALRDLIVRAQVASAQNPDATPAQKRVAADFYRTSLRRIDAVHC